MKGIGVQVKPRGGNVRKVSRAKMTLVEEALQVAADSGVPDAQRDPDRLALLKAPKIGDGPRTADQTVRRRTRVEILARAGVIEPHEADACEWYAEIMALAWDTTGVVANYEGRSGGGGRFAPDVIMAKRDDVAIARDLAREASALLPPGYRCAFEAIVLRNEAMGPTAAAAFPDLARSRAGERLRTVIRFCAGKLGEVYGARMGWRDAPAPARSASPRPSAPKPQVATIQPEATLVDAIGEAIERAGPGHSELWMAEAVYDELRAILGVHQIDQVDGLSVVVRENWRWGYVVIQQAGA